MTDSTRIVRRKIPDGVDLPDTLHPVLRRIYAARNVNCADDIDLSLGGMHPIGQLGNIETAAELLANAIADSKRILVVGDFDADGATSCAVAVRGLRALGSTDVDFLVPNRFEYGYGLTPEIVEVAKQRNPDILITVDNGISSIEGVKATRAAGIQVIVTDHHLPGKSLPDANVIVNPNLVNDPFPSKYLAGVGVMFYVLIALRARLRETGIFADGAGPNLAELLDLVALGTVADVVPLDKNNRILVAQGLARIRAGHGHAGIRALLSVAKKDYRRITASDLGFAIGPRLNAAGRLEDMSLGVDCLLCDDESDARVMADRLHQLNVERREIEDEMRGQAMVELESLDLSETGLPAGLSLFDERWHQGVIGILAARIREKTHRPVVAFATNGDKDIKGSARSVPGLHIRDVIDAVAVKNPGLIDSYGGHAMAAGLGLARSNYELFRAAFEAEVGLHLNADDFHGVIHSDGRLDGSDLGMSLATQLREAGPWGQAFPEPIFDGEFTLLSQRIVGERHLKMELIDPGTGQVMDAIAFGTEALPGGEGKQFLVAYRLDVNEFRGRTTAQLMVEHIRPADAAPDSVSNAPGSVGSGLETEVG